MTIKPLYQFFARRADTAPSKIAVCTIPNRLIKRSVGNQVPAQVTVCSNAQHLTCRIRDKYDAKLIGLDLVNASRTNELSAMRRLLIFSGVILTFPQNFAEPQIVFRNADIYKLRIQSNGP